MNSRPVALITGASRGIGAATAIEFAVRGYDLAITAPKGESFDAVLSKAADALVVVGDLVNPEFVKSLVPGVLQKFGRLDVLVNNAAWRELVSMRLISLESWEKTLRICLTAPAFLAKGAAEAMERQRRGMIINVSSVMASRATGIAPAYVAAKGALDALTYDLASLYGPSGIRVLSVSPGAIDTEMSRDTSQRSDAARDQTESVIPLRRWGTAEEVARAIAMLASDDASYITGATVLVDGGWKHQLYPHEDTTR